MDLGGQTRVNAEWCTPDGPNMSMNQGNDLAMCINSVVGRSALQMTYRNDVAFPNTNIAREPGRT
jgi:hypothetical protein